MPGFSSRRLVIGGGMDAVAGWLLIGAELDSRTDQVDVSFFYRLSGQSGLLDSTGVDSSLLDDGFSFPVERSSSGVDTGIAIRGVPAASFQLWDETGQSLGFAAQTPGDGARLLTDLFPGLPPDFIGRLEIRSESGHPFYATVLRIEFDATGGVQLTSVPPNSLIRRRDRR